MKFAKKHPATPAGSSDHAEELAACIRLSDEIDRRLAAMLARLDKLEGKGK